MKVKKTDLRKVLKEFVPKAVAQSVQPSVRPEDTPISRGVQGSGKGIFLRINLPELENVELKFVDRTGGPDSTFQFFTEKYEEIKSKVGGYAIDSIIEKGVLPIPAEVADSPAMDDIRKNLEFSKSLLYNNNEILERKKKASIASEKGSKITVLGVYRSRTFEDDTSGTASVHVVIRTRDVENLVMIVKNMLTEPDYEQDLENIRRIMFFLSGDSSSFEAVFGTKNSFGSKFLTQVKSTANKYLGTYFDDKDFERAAGNRILCSTREDNGRLFDAVQYFNEQFNSLVNSLEEVNPTLKKNFSLSTFDLAKFIIKSGLKLPFSGLSGIDTAELTKLLSGGVTGLIGPKVVLQPAARHLLDVFTDRLAGLGSELSACDNVIQAINSNLDITPDTPTDQLVSIIRENKTIIKLLGLRYVEAQQSAAAYGFNNTGPASLISHIRPPLDISESIVSKENTLLEALNTGPQAGQNSRTLSDYIDDIDNIQSIGGLSDIANLTTSAEMQFFLKGDEKPVGESNFKSIGNSAIEVSDFFISQLKKHEVAKLEKSFSDILEADINTLVLENPDEIAFFIRLDDLSYVNPFQFYGNQIKSDFLNYANSFTQAEAIKVKESTGVSSVDSAEAEPDKTEVETGDRKSISCPDYSQRTSGLVRQLERIVNDYNKSIGESELMSIDGSWKGDEDSAWGEMVAHALGSNGKSPAKDKINVDQNLIDQLSSDWKNGSKKLVANGMKGYTGNAAGALAFAYDAYTDGSNTSCGWERPLRSGGRRSGASTEPAQKTSGLPKRSANDIKVSLAEKLKDNKDASGIVERIKSQMKMHVPESVSKEIKIVVQTKTGGAPRFQSRSDINSQLRQPDELIRFIKTTISGLKNTKGVINIVIPKGVYTLNESPAQELVALIQELVKQK